jgi:dienelactone hydrolase
MKPSLNDLFVFDDGSKVNTSEDWRCRRQQLLSRIVEMEYGGLPPRPASIQGECLHNLEMPEIDNRKFQTYRISTGPDGNFNFSLTLMIPSGEGPFPVALCGDACWPYANNQVSEACLERGYIFALFNRTEFAADVYSSDRKTGLYPLYPDLHFGALAAWAWGYHRCVDFLLTLAFVRSDQIAITGHSRGGKTALLAGATDERIALTAPNNSGNGGAGSYHIKGPNCETLFHGMRDFPYWYGPQMAEYTNSENALPFDQHELKAAIAPRAYFSSEAYGDHWANPMGTWHTHTAAKKVWDFLNVPNKIAIHYREGLHEHSLADWLAFLDFADQQFKPSSNQRIFQGYHES